MSDSKNVFFDNVGPFTVRQVADHVGAELRDEATGKQVLQRIAPLSEAKAGDVTFLDNPKYLEQLASTGAGACLIRTRSADALPAGVTAILTEEPYRAFAKSLHLFYPTAKTSPVLGDSTTDIAPTAKLEDGVVIEPGARVGPEAEIGRGTRVAAGAVIGYRCTVGRDCFIGSNTTVICTHIGDRVTLHAGVRVGQDGFGFAMGAQGHLKVPQIGRVIIQDDVEIGANSTVDRGALKDTIIGEGCKIDNLVQIGHNVVLGRGCVIVAQVGISGSTELGDFVVMGGQSGAAGHVKIGTGTQIAGASHVKDDVPPGSRMGGTPARPFREWARELAAVSSLVRKRGDAGR